MCVKLSPPLPQKCAVERADKAPPLSGGGGRCCALRLRVATELAFYAAVGGTSKQEEGARLAEPPINKWSLSRRGRSRQLQRSGQGGARQPSPPPPRQPVTATPLPSSWAASAADPAVSPRPPGLPPQRGGGMCVALSSGHQLLVCVCGFAKVGWRDAPPPSRLSNRAATIHHQPWTDRRK